MVLGRAGTLLAWLYAALGCAGSAGKPRRPASGHPPARPRAARHAPRPAPLGPAQRIAA